MRPGSGRDFSIWGSPHHAAVGDCVRSETLRSGDNCETLEADHRSGIGYSETRTGTAARDQGVHAFQLSHALEQGEPIDQLALDCGNGPLESHLVEDGKGLGRPGLAILVLILTAVLMAAPGLIAVITILNSSFDLTHGLSKQALDVGWLVGAARLPVGIALVFVVWKAPREQ